jgi:RHS repeat-associated protein
MNGVSYTVDATTNRRTGGDGLTTYDANGNVTQWGQAGYGWDIENRMTSNGAVYDPWGKRVGVGTQVYFYSLSGQRLTGPNGVNRYFGGKLLQSNGVGVATDRLGSVRANGNGERMVYTAYGTERTSTADGREKFGTYFRDGVGLDYADQRYYGDSGRFLSPDPGGVRTADATDPESWNRYGYANGDPVNRRDRHGRAASIIWNQPTAQECTADPDDPQCGDPCGPLSEALVEMPMPYCPTGGGDGPEPEPGPAPPRVPAFLLVTADCDYQGLTGTIRQRTYEVLDQSYQPMGNGVNVYEAITDVTPSGNVIVGGGNWTTGSSNEPAGAFNDYYGNGVNTTPTNALQQYFVAVSGGSPIQLTVLEPDDLSGSPQKYSSYGTQGVYYTNTGTKIDGYWLNPIVGSRKPCDPPGPAF